MIVKTVEEPILLGLSRDMTLFEALDTVAIQGHVVAAVIRFLVGEVQLWHHFLFHYGELRFRFASV